MAKTVDLRTYLALEKAFVRRLQRSWRIQSAPIYAQITQACIDHHWDEARRLVPELDMAEVGTQNREWIQYMLLSCAVFGAGTVRKNKPSFVGVGTFDTLLKQVTDNFLTYLELTATSQIQAEALQSIAEDEAKTKALPKVAQEESQKPAGVGGLTRKFDEAAHPRGTDGRFIEATQPRIFNRPSDVGSYNSWGETKWGWLPTQEEIAKYGYPPDKPTGRLLTGEPIPRDQIPSTLYHVTTNAPAVESSGVLLGLLESGGLGGGQAQGVSFTSSKEDATVIQRELKRAVQIARGSANEKMFNFYARQDEEEAHLPKGSLQYAVDQALQTWDGNKYILEGQYIQGKGYSKDDPLTPEAYEEKRRSLMKDAFNSYLWARETAAEKATGQRVPLLKNPILFSDQKLLAKINPEHVQILEASPEDIPAEALVTTGSDKFLHEVRVYADVPRRRKAAREYVREPAGSSEGGQFATTGGLASDPVLAVQAKAGVAAVEKLIPQALKTADFSNVKGTWDELPESTKGRVERYYIDSRYDSINIDPIDAELTVDVRRNLKEDATADTAKMIAEKTKVWIEGSMGPMALDRYALDKTVSQGKPLDFSTLKVLKTQEGFPVLDLKALRHLDDTELTEHEQGIVQNHWKHQYERVIEDEVQKVQDTDEYLNKREDRVRQALRQQWKATTDSEKAAFIPEMIAEGQFAEEIARGDNVYGVSQVHEPAHWVTGVETGTHEEGDYARTHALALKLTELRTDELRKERGLLDQGVKPEYTISERPEKIWQAAPFVAKAQDGHIVAFGKTKEAVTQDAEQWANEVANRTPIATGELIQAVWTNWKRSSSEGLSLSLQLAAANELGGHHRMEPGEMDAAIFEARPYGGIPTLQAYIRAQWEVTQTIMQKAGEDKIEVYRGLMLPGEAVKGTPQQQLNKFGTPIAPTNIKEKTDSGANLVNFDFDGNHFVVARLLKPPTHIADIEPRTWHDLTETEQTQVHNLWLEDAKTVELHGVVDEAKNIETATKLFKKFSDSGKLDSWRQYVRAGRMQGRPVPPQLLESADEAVQRRIDDYLSSSQASGEVFTQLPDMKLQRAGAQSTTGTRSVANEWGGVGNLPDNPVRVVLRIEAPPTSVLSLPVYGANIQEEHESVILGTKDHWLWDAWKDKAPPLTRPHTIDEEMDDEESGLEYIPIKKAEKTPLVIDLQAEDRGKPHWLSGVDWTTAKKFDEAQHPRDAKGQFAPYYHGTSDELAQKILKEGLKPLSDIDPDSGVTAGKAFAATSEKVALSYAAMASDDSVDTITVIVFKPEASQFFKPAGKEMKGNPVPGSWGDARRTEMSSTETVPPDMIQEVRQYRLADVIAAIGPRKGKQYADWETPLEDLDPVSVVKKADQIYVAILTNSGAVVKWDESEHPRDDDGQFTRVAMTSQRTPGDPGHQPNAEVFRHMHEFHQQLKALPGVSNVSVKPGVGGWEGGSESMWQIYYKGNGEARKLVARTAKQFNQDAVLILNKCDGKDCQPAVELSFQGAVTPRIREKVHGILVKNGIGGWTWMKRDGKTLLRMVSVPQWGGVAETHQKATVAVSQQLREIGLKNTRRLHKVAVSVMEREGQHSYDSVIG